MKKSRIILLSVLCSLLTLGTTSCDRNSDNDFDIGRIQFDDMTMTVGQKIEIAKGKDLKWTSGNEMIAKVMEGNVIGIHVGQTTLSSQKGSFTATVKGSIDGYAEPYIQFGQSRSAVKYYVADDDKLIRNVDTLMIYGSKDKVEYAIYHFSDNKLDGAYIATAAENQKELQNWATERYISVMTTDGSTSYCSLDMKTNINTSTATIFGKEYIMLEYKQ